VSHEVFSVVAPVDPARVRDLERLLDPRGDARTPIPGLPLEEIPSLHFASFVVFPGTPIREQPGWRGRLAGTGPRTLTPHPVLVFESAVDGPIGEYLDALVHVGSKTLRDIFGHCLEPVPDGGPEVLRQYLDRHVRRPHLWHVGNPGLRTDHVDAGARLRDALDHELDREFRTRRPVDRPLDLRDRLRRTLKVPPSDRQHWHFAGSLARGPGSYRWFADAVSRWPSRVWHWLGLTPVALVMVAALGSLGWLWATGGTRWLLVVLLAGFVVSVIVWRWLLGRHPAPVVDAAHLQRLKELEDVGVQNHMASLVLLKGGWLRRVSIRLVLGVFNRFYRTVFTDITPGRILGLATIHFAQWTILPLRVTDDQGRIDRREGLLFLSNYDGSWESYLDDFVAFLRHGVFAIWSNAVGFPSPIDGPTFKAWARTCMSPWHSWYRRHPHLTVLNIEGNEAIRRGLIAPPASEAEARLWLARFGSLKSGHEDLPEGQPALETGDMQGVVLSGYQHLPESAYVLLHVERPGAVREWIGALADHVGDARSRQKSELARELARFNVAFTWSGLRALGLPQAVLERFPLVFREGMAPKGLEHRSRALGDTDENAPERWLWGSPDRPSVDLLLMVYAIDRKWLCAAVESQVDSLVAAGALTHLGCLSGRLRAPSTPGSLPPEPFGFADGISQPVIEGSPAAERAGLAESSHVLKAGEFVLGYTAGDGSPSAGISVEPTLDPHLLLPPDVWTGGGLRDFGRNGSYLVVRQLEQDVEAFQRDMSRGSESYETLGARAVGRWRDGTPLVTGAAPGPRSNDFTFAGDPHGFGCPIGAHIRRANPRDSLHADPAEASRSANRHRLMRRGRPYRTFDEAGLSRDHDDDSPDQGTVFLCLNSDIERQFEFVQQNWIANPAFGGLYAEQDPLLGPPGFFTVQRDELRARFRFDPPRRFVTVRGGAYFFLPGLSALRYLATIASPAGVEVPAPVADPRPHPVAPRLTRPSWLRRALAFVQALLPRLRVAWAVRFPIAVGAALVLLAWTPRLAPEIGTNLFLTDGVGLALVAMLASLAGVVVMVTLRLVLLYGWRVGLGRARWAGPARWWQVLAFQALALPLAISSLHRSAADAAGAVGTARYWTAAMELAVAVVLGFGAALAVLGAATGLQALQPGSRPDLFFPPNRIAALLSGRGWRPRILLATSERLTQLGRWVVDAVPEELGRGYIDYRRRRLLPGHLFAAVLAVVVFAGYFLGYVVLNPAWTGLAARVPPVAYVVIVLMLAGWWLSAAAFFLDRYRLPTLVVVLAWLALVASAARTDHVFAVGRAVPRDDLSPVEIVARAASRYPNRGVVVVTSEGLGLASSAWTAEVLTRLSAELGRTFTESLRLISVSSGAALGTASFVAEFGPGGLPPDRALHERVRRRARAPSSNEAAWGLVYPDLVRTVAPILVPRLADRGWAMEQAWRRTLGADPTLWEWRQGVRAGWRPATAFGVTVVETGQRGVLATYDSPVPSTDVTGGRDLAVVTAARLSASFPYVTPVARADAAGEGAGYHVADGGYWDNFGTVEAVEWLRAARPAIGSRRVLIVEILSAPARTPPPPQERAWTLDFVGPIRALYEVRLDGQRVRKETELELLEELWRTGRLTRVRFSLSADLAPLTWNLGTNDIRRIERAWARPDNRASFERVRDWLGAP
jgi:Dyp-type peroxidase family